MGPIDCLLAVLNRHPARLQVSDSLDQFMQTVLDRLRNSSELDEIVGDLISTDVKASLVVAQAVRVHAAAVTVSQITRRMSPAGCSGRSRDVIGIQGGGQQSVQTGLLGGSAAALHR